MARRVVVRVRGRVQGVWFRESTRRHAEAAGLSGWVRNAPDGSVEAQFEGDEAAVDSALAFVRRGPPAARVSAVEVIDEATIATPEPTGFSIRR